MTRRAQPDRTGPGRPPLPEGQALVDRRTVRFDQADAALLADLAATLGVTEPDVLRDALRDYARRKLR